jgi:tetratricopeptide (TPR) repeat protein
VTKLQKSEKREKLENFNETVLPPYNHTSILAVLAFRFKAQQQSLLRYLFLHHHKFNMLPFNKMSSNVSLHQQMKESRELYADGKDKFACGDFDDALQLLRQAVQMHEVLFGKYHQETVTSYWWIGKAACKVQKKTDALKAFQRATRMAGSAFDRATYQEMCCDIEECWAEMHPEQENILKVLHTIFEHEQKGDKAFKGRNYNSAIDAYCQALSLQDSLIGNDSLDGADIRCKLAYSLLKTSATPEAEKTLQLAYDCYIDHVGADHPATYGAAAKMKTIVATQ